MGLIEFLFGKNKTIEDDFFGTMTFLGNEKKSSPKNYFECYRFFKPSKDNIEIGIEGDIIGPTQIQKDFFLKIEHNYHQFSIVIAPTIEKRYKEWQPNFKIKDFNKEFKPTYLSIPRCERSPVEWEISFESDLDLNHISRVYMEDFTVKGAYIDG